MPDTAQKEVGQPAPTAASTDPATLKVMQGFPPPPEKTAHSKGSE